MLCQAVNMRKFLQHIQRFQHQQPQRGLKSFLNLLCERLPGSLLITCCDLRLHPCLTARSSIDHELVVRKVGKAITAHDVARSSEAAMIEYAVGILKVSNVIIYGHTDCAVAQTHAHSNMQGNAVGSWLYNANFPGQSACVTASAESRQATERNVLMQMANLRTHPAVKVAEERSHLAVHGWVYDDRTRHVSAYEPTEDCFVHVVRQYAA